MFPVRILQKGGLDVKDAWCSVKWAAFLLRKKHIICKIQNILLSLGSNDGNKLGKWYLGAKQDMAIGLLHLHLHCE